LGTLLPKGAKFSLDDSLG